jgi:hypothetical protein
MAKYIYKGGGYMIGLPARDMTEDEWKSYPQELTKPALKLGLYELSKPKPTKEVKDA